MLRMQNDVAAKALKHFVLGHLAESGLNKQRGSNLKVLHFEVL